MRSGCIAAMYGFFAGVLTTFVLLAMRWIEHIVWSGPESGWYIFLIIMSGGLLIAFLRHFYEGSELSEQLAYEENQTLSLHSKAMLMAAMAIVAVAFGGAVGPEAGILAFITEIYGLVGYYLIRKEADRHLIAEAGKAGALGSLYGSPPAGALIVDENLEAPQWQLYLAGIAGLAGFLWTSSYVLQGEKLRISLPEHTPAGDGTDMLYALLPAILGALVGYIFIQMLSVIKSSLLLSGNNVVVQTLIGSAIFALLCAALPILRFSGHHELEAMLHWGQSISLSALLLLATLKVFALSLCLASGWRGGAGFPLIFAGAAAGAATMWVLPEMPSAVALAAGISACLTAGLGRPLPAMLIAILLIDTTAIGAMMVGTLVGWIASKYAGPTEMH